MNLQIATSFFIWQKVQPFERKLLDAWKGLLVESE
jgi:hypothetical protein